MGRTAPRTPRFHPPMEGNVDPPPRRRTRGGDWGLGLAGVWPAEAREHAPFRTNRRATFTGRSRRTVERRVERARPQLGAGAYPVPCAHEGREAAPIAGAQVLGGRQRTSKGGCAQSVRKKHWKEYSSWLFATHVIVHFVHDHGNGKVHTLALVVEIVSAVEGSENGAARGVGQHVRRKDTSKVNRHENPLCPTQTHKSMPRVRLPVKLHGSSSGCCTLRVSTRTLARLEARAPPVRSNRREVSVAGCMARDWLEVWRVNGSHTARDQKGRSIVCSLY